MSEPPFGDVGIPPALFYAFVRALTTELLDLVPEESREEVAEAIAQALDEVRPRPARAGETILFGDAAHEALKAEVRKAVEQLRRDSS